MKAIKLIGILVMCGFVFGFAFAVTNQAVAAFGPNCCVIPCEGMGEDSYGGWAHSVGGGVYCRCAYAEGLGMDSLCTYECNQCAMP